MVTMLDSDAQEGGARELSHELLTFERHLWTQMDKLQMSMAQLHGVLRLLHGALTQAYDGSMEQLLKRSTEADECSRFAQALGHELAALAGSESTRKGIAARLKLVLSFAGLPAQFVSRVRTPIRDAVEFNKILGKKYGRAQARNAHEAAIKKLLEGWIDILHSETKQTSPLTLRNTMSFVVNSCLPAFDLSLEAWPCAPREAIQAGLAQNPDVVRDLCGPPGSQGARTKAQWLTYFLRDIMDLPGAVPLSYFSKRRVRDDTDDPNRGDVHRIQSADLEKIYEVAKQNVKDELLFLLLLTTALRVGGLVRIHLSSVADVVSGQYRVRTQGRTREKGNKLVSFMLSGRVQALIHSWLTDHRPASPSPYLFPAKAGSGPVSTEAVRGAFSRLCRAAGLQGKEFHCHGVRHTTAHLLLEAGNSVDVVSKCLNHSSSQITEQVYLKENIQEICSRASIPWLQGEQAAPPPRMPSFLAAAPGESHTTRKKKRIEKNLASLDMLK